ncbi:MAG: hypothetical protein RJA70_4829, partial [Pseudomonadota bacterium]
GDTLKGGDEVSKLHHSDRTLVVAPRCESLYAHRAEFRSRPKLNNRTAASAVLHAFSFVIRGGFSEIPRDARRSSERI